ncbi:hypothetical protein A2856_01170 [Candidatus Uhrbacteria bacterium RIFCSPHIGHO2_01_FULL_63_20]|uniref:Carbohydrate-binding domain-containing protein n=1 Tax=Candidatus Uhrbacteria bacterium RIFCSPHIGHO2_01_FULL_63_20 TaxID=1802385 RepID=A0A1F7TP15_9BACT|nr:MAG: hypothetical protein A2856_01170 [Candidatus Uhrbacteria bacterium RIFCSPHIGHO2_01_FULL_63_20]
MKKFSFTLTTLITLTTLLPLGAFANDAGQAGTDDHLRDELGMTDEQLSRAVATEDREPFGALSGADEVTDPLGDVLDRWGRATALHQPWGDIERVSVSRDAGGESWDFTVKLGAELPNRPTDKVTLYVYADADGLADNDAPGNGVRGGMDSEFALQHNADAGWYADFRWYNPEPAARTWAINRETAMRWRMKGDTVTINIPFSEMPGQAPRWRVVMGISDGERTEVDVAPGIGFPPPIGETAPTAPAWYQPIFDLHDRTYPADVIVGLAMLASIGYLVVKHVRP